MKNSPKTFVLVPGAWMGDWVWQKVIPQLESLGHRTYSLTLSGVKKNADPSSISLQTHVDNVLTLIRTNDLHNVVLVGHSYSGLVVGMVADQLPQRIHHTVFVHAFLPHDGKSLLDAFGEEQSRLEKEEIIANDGCWLPPTSEHIMGDQSLSDEQKRWLLDQIVAHPGRTVTEPVKMRQLFDLNATLIDCNIEGDPSDDLKGKCTAFQWTYHLLKTGHWPMITLPDELVKLMVEVGE